MLYLNPHTFKIRKAKKEHKERLLDLIFKRIDKLENIYSILLFDSIIINDLESILESEPKTLFRLSNSLMNIIGRNESLIDDVKSVFNYNWFIDKTVNRYSGYHLAKLIDVSTCVYCNRNYTTTVITKSGKKLIRPQFDHYFDKDRHPLLALSFFNLIPSCSICNTSVKNNKEFKLNSHTHPYIDDVSGGFEFSYSYNSDPFYKNGLKIDVNVHSDIYIKNLINDMEIEEVYNSHTDLLYDLIRTRQAYSDRYLSILENNILLGITLSRSEIYRLVFGVFLENSDFQKRPFSKFKKDILTELKLI